MHGKNLQQRNAAQTPHKKHNKVSETCTPSATIPLLVMKDSRVNM